MKTAMYFAYIMGVITILSGVLFAFGGHIDLLFTNLIVGGLCIMMASLCRDRLKIIKNNSRKR